MTAYSQGSLWYYAPNKPAPIAFAILFGISFVWHVCNCIKYKSWRLAGILAWGTSLLVAGYALRAFGAWHDKDLGIYIASTVLLVLGPPIYAAHLYIVLGRTMYFVPWLSPMHPGRVITTFLGLDFICGIILGSGISRSANKSLSQSQRNLGVNLTRAGLIIQVVMFVCYLWLAAHFHMRCIKNRVASKIRGVMVVLYVTGILILERSIYRVVEFFQGYTGTIYTTEPLFWVFEASAMLIVTYVLNIWAPARLLPQSNKIYLATDGVTEREGPGWADKRLFIVTLFDPFDLIGMCTGRHSNDKFWENDEGPVVSTDKVAKNLDESPA